MHMSSLITNTISIFLGLSCITVIRCQVQPTQPKSQNEANEIDDDSLSNLDDQLSTINPLIWVIIVLICIVCCLCTVFICYCVMQNKFNKEMAQVHQESQLTLRKQLGSFSTTDKTDINVHTLQPPSNRQSRSHSPPSHSMQSQPEPPSINKMMPPQLLPRSKSADSLPRDISINIRPDKISPNARHNATNSAGNGQYHQYVNSVRMWTNPVYHTKRESGMSGHTNAMSLTIPSTRYEEYSNGSEPTITYISSNGSRQRTSPVPNVAIHNHQKTSIQQNRVHRQYQPRVSRSVPSQMSHDQEVPTPIPGTPPPAAMHNMAIQQHQSMIYTPHKSSLKSIRSMVPNQYKPLPKLPPKVSEVKIPPASNGKERLHMNLEQALHALTPPNHGPGFDDGDSDVAWTEASMTGNNTVLILKDMPSNDTDVTGIAAMMLGGDKRKGVDNMDRGDEDDLTDSY